MMITLLFDIDGTLIRTGGAGKVAMEHALRGAFAVETIQDVVPFSGRTDPAIGHDLLTVHGHEPSAENVARLSEAYLRALPGALAKHGGEVLPGVRALLQELSQRNDVLLGLLTGNVREGARKKLAHFGLWDYFGFGGFGDLYTSRDDVARMAYRAAEEHAGRPIDPQSVWVIGDTPHDVSCARAVSANVVAVATGWHALDELHLTGADLVLEDLGDPGRYPAPWGWSSLG